MKRRAGDGAKLRRPHKRTKIADGFYSSTLLYLKFLLLWAIIILADFLLEFRFEFLWPFWMLLRSVYDSFKYQGLAFSMFFVCIALTSDMICFFFIPVQWVFFAASTYVWVQYIWYTDKGICLPTMILCSVFIYMEAGVRLRDLRHMPAHLDLCRPFAAHCIGYPVVTLGFGFKSYVGYRMRKRRQQEVARENSFYMQLLQQALPPHEDSQQQQSAIKETEKSGVLSLEKTPESHLPEKQMNGNAIHLNSSKSSGHSKKSDTKNNQHNDKILSSSHHNHTLHNHNNHTAQGANTQISNFKDVSPESSGNDSGLNSHSKSHTSQNQSSITLSNHTSIKEKDREQNKMYTQMMQSSSAQNKHAQLNGVAGHSCSDKSSVINQHHCNSLPIVNIDKHIEERNSTSISQPDKDAAEQKSNNHTQNSESVVSDFDVSFDKNAKASLKANTKLEKKDTNVVSQREERRKNKNKDREVNKERESVESGQKHSDQSKDRENDANAKSAAGAERVLRAAQAAERQARTEITQLRQQIEQLTSKINSTNASRQADRTALATAERRLNEERRARQAADARLRGMHKSGECVWEWCRQRRLTLEQEVNSLREELQQMRDHNQTVTQSLQAAEQQVSTLEARSRDSGAEAWLATVKSLRERCLHLECSLSAETRVKLDLFSAVGEAKRQLDLRGVVIREQEKENEELKGKIAQMLAVMPNDTFNHGPPAGISKLRLSDSGMACYPSHLAHHNVGNSLTNTHNMSNNVNNVNTNLNNSMSNLDPNATAYTPKGAMVQCGPAAEA